MLRRVSDVPEASMEVVVGVNGRGSAQPTGSATDSLGWRVARTSPMRYATTNPSFVYNLAPGAPGAYHLAQSSNEPQTRYVYASLAKDHNAYFSVPAHHNTTRLRKVPANSTLYMSNASANSPSFSANSGSACANSAVYTKASLVYATDAASSAHANPSYSTNFSAPNSNIATPNRNGLMNFVSPPSASSYYYHSNRASNSRTYPQVYAYSSLPYNAANGNSNEQFVANSNAKFASTANANYKSNSNGVLDANLNSLEFLENVNPFTPKSAKNCQKRPRQHVAYAPSSSAASSSAKDESSPKAKAKISLKTEIVEASEETDSTLRQLLNAPSALNFNDRIGETIQRQAEIDNLAEEKRIEKFRRDVAEADLIIARRIAYLEKMEGPIYG